MSLRALRTPLTMAVLTLLREQPRHPYELQALVRARHVGEVVKLRGGSLYDSVARLHRAGLVEPVETSRSGARPERTAYAITDAGRDLLDALVREYVGVPAQEYPVFAAGLAHILNLAAGDAADLLDARAHSLQAEIDETDGQLESLRESGIARVVLLEVEYAQVLRRAEVHWLSQIVEALREGAIPWIDATGATKGPETTEATKTTEGADRAGSPATTAHSNRENP